MMNGKANIKIEMVEIPMYFWDCPMCDSPLKSQVEPDELHCNDCQNVLAEREYQEWVARFRNGHAFLTGAVVVDFVPYDEYWWGDFEPGIVEIIVERNGKRYRLFASSGLIEAVELAEADESPEVEDEHRVGHTSHMKGW